MHRHRNRSGPLRDRIAAITLAGVATTVGVLAFAGPAFAANSVGDPNNIVANPNFATPAAPAGSFLSLAAGDTSLSGWSIGGGGIDVQSPGYRPTPAGDPTATQSVDLNAVSAGSISQTLTTTAGVTYTGSFEVLDTGTGTLIVPGQAPIPFAGTANDAWTEIPFSFTASGSSSVITFTSTVAGALGPNITDVIVDPPLTGGSPLASPAIAASGFAAVGALALGYVLVRRRRGTAVA